MDKSHTDEIEQNKETFSNYSKDNLARKIRIGIDVGGTFTHAVALDALTLELIEKIKVPTTHSAKEGVAKGIILALHELLEKAKIDPSEVSFIAHSTTQATNALLEGDLAKVGILAMGAGFSKIFARIQTNLGKISLNEGHSLVTYFEFVDTSLGFSENKIRESLLKLKESGAEAIAVSEAFGVDFTENEEKAVLIAQILGLPATCGSAISKLYGLKIRTRTAVINAAMLPKMIETANMTESSVREAGIKAPIMIMRSDGGVMDIDAMRKRPILTRLSGPAAGVAAAMMYLRISDAIFLEVGGTSTDISVIRNGKALVTDSEIAGNKIYLRSLDVNTLGIAGGSMLRVKQEQGKAKIISVGPRSAHIAGLAYASFVKEFADELNKNSRAGEVGKIELISPKEGDAKEYLAIFSDTAKFTITPTCAANLLGFVPKGDCAEANKNSLEKSFQLLSNYFENNSEKIAETVLDLAYQKCLPALKKFITDYKLDKDALVFVGGGGGAAAIVPYVAKRMGVQHILANNADVISAIGVALALVRETIERQVVNPKQEDLVNIRQEVLNAVTSMGANPENIEIQVEIDPRKNILRATAYGATGLTETIQNDALTEAECIKNIAESLKVKESSLNLAASTNYFRIFAANTYDKKLFGLLSSKQNSIRAIDNKGVIRLKMRNAICKPTTVAQIESDIAELAELYSDYGDAGKIIPNFMLLSGPRIIDLSGLLDTWQVQTMARSELNNLAPNAEAIILAAIP